MLRAGELTLRLTRAWGGISGERSHLTAFTHRVGPVPTA